MATPISPGVYTTITDLSTYVAAVPSTIGFICGLTKKGQDNTLRFIGGRAEFISEFGEPNITEYGKNYGQGPYCAYNYLGESGSLFFIRCMPDNAAFSNLKINAKLAVDDDDASIVLDYINTANSIKEIRTSVDNATATTFPLCVLYPIGRGEYYNTLSVKLTAHANPMLPDIYVLDIYEKMSDGDEVIVESFEVSFDPNSKDSTGDSIWIQYILNNYSSLLRCEMTTDGDSEFSSGFNTLVKVYDKNIGTVEVDISTGSSTLTDLKQDFSDWGSSSAPYQYAVEVIDQRGNKLYGWLGTATDDEVAIFNGRVTGATQSWIGDTSIFDLDGEITYRIKKSFASISSGFSSDEPVPLKKGSDGSLLDSSGNLDTAEATALLTKAYTGKLGSVIDGGISDVDEMLDQENIYYSIVFDCGYPKEVKTAISELVQTRRDCVGILDNGDNSTVELALQSRLNDQVQNNYFCALYEEYNKVYDSFTGQDIWVSPIFHMSYLLPRNDNVAEVWFAAAGFNRAAIDSIKELRYNPRLGQRDQMYLKQLNPIVKFNPGYTVWGQLTTQAKPSALQDLNIVRLVLYIKRALEQYCRYFIFEQNDAVTWGQVSAGIVSFLDNIQQRRGLYSYSVDVGATDYEKKTKTFHVNITLEPTRVVEKISLNFFIK